MDDVAEHQIFISYARPDREFAGEVYEFLRKGGFDPWIDYRRLVAGQNWDFEIKRALEKSELIVVLISESSIDRRGYLQKEIKAALSKRQEKLIDDIFVIPVILSDEIGIPREFEDIHCIYATAVDFKKQLSDSINLQIVRLGGSRRQFQQDQDLYWTTSVKKESWDGVPGYEVEIQTFDFESEQYPNVREIGHYVRGMFLKDLFRLRGNKLSPSSGGHNYAQDKWARTDTFDAHCSEPIIKGKILTLNYAVNWYSAGAAHPNHHFVTFAFVLEPLVLISELRQIFTDEEAALEIVRNECRSQLRQALSQGSEPEFYNDWIDGGTSEWDDFGAFVFAQDAVEILFAPYQVASYADGPQAATIAYRALLRLIKPEFQTALGIEHLHYAVA
ncbi:TIR domain-containing protein [Mesorhizobium sp. KR2-14]|uniref:TIR domain-containing protein n=1 Tax=Mesorhizobium sp. KR2-14 TaxID=3156610 RepID=UPI0032B4E375